MSGITARLWLGSLLLTAACQKDESAPYYQPPGPDASDELATDADVMDAAMMLDASSSSQRLPDHVSQSCEDFSSGAVHARARWGDFLTELSPDGTQHKICSKIPGGIARIRQTDGRLLYLSNGYIYQFVPDEEGATTPFDNDVQLTVKNRCPANPKPDRGPFKDFRLKPNGLVVYRCVAPPDPDSPFMYYDEAGNTIGSWAYSMSRIGIDNDGRMLQADRYIQQRNDSIALTAHKSSKDYEVLKIRGPSGCLTGAAIFAFYTLPKGFLIATRNSCGLQLWASTQTTLEFKGYYVHQAAAADTVAEGEPLGYGQLASDGTLYFQTPIRITSGWRIDCDGEPICALLPNQKQSDPMRLVTMKPPGDHLWSLWDETNQHPEGMPVIRH